MVQNSRKSLSNTLIMTFFPGYGYADYFKVQMILSELVENSQLLAVTRENRTTYFITDSGKSSLAQLDHFIPPAVQEDLDRYIASLQSGDGNGMILP